MHTAASDVTAKAAIRIAALDLFAEHDADAVSVRRIAERAGVSPALVIHHFGSKAELEQAVADHVSSTLISIIEGDGLDELTDEMVRRDSHSLAEVLRQALPVGSPIPRYLGRLLLSGSPVGVRLFRSWYELTLQILHSWGEAGLLQVGDDPQVRAAMLLSNDLGGLMLHDHVTRVLGFDPYEGEGALRWTKESFVLYSAMLPGPGDGDLQHHEQDHPDENNDVAPGQPPERS